MSTKYDLQYFIRFFERIPHRMWAVDEYRPSIWSACAYGHCRGLIRGTLLTYETPRSRSLSEITYYSHSIKNVNDGETARYHQSHPKDRVLAYLRDLQKIEQREVES